jgi:hypothetical protein
MRCRRLLQVHYRSCSAQQGHCLCRSGPDASNWAAYTGGGVSRLATAWSVLLPPLLHRAVCRDSVLAVGAIREWDRQLQRRLQAALLPQLVQHLHAVQARQVRVDVLDFQVHRHLQGDRQLLACATAMDVLRRRLRTARCQDQGGCGSAHHAARVSCSSRRTCSSRAARVTWPRRSADRASSTRWMRRLGARSTARWYADSASYTMGESETC